MNDQRDGGIAWTPMTDRGGRRVRFYPRKMPGPGKRMCREMLAMGFRWCRGCKEWLAEPLIRSGVCRSHANAEYRAQYANGAKVAIAARVHARKRQVAPVDPFQREILLEQSAGRCVYCGGQAATFDHVVAVAKGGRTSLGNIVPACVSCNSRKRTRDVDDFVAERGCLDVLVDMIVMAEAA